MYSLAKALLVIMLLTTNPITTSTQQNDIILTVALYPGFGATDNRTLAIFDQFEEANPNVEVVPVRLDHPGVFSDPSYDLGLHFQGSGDASFGVDDYARQADVLFMFDGELTAEATKAGYFLDLLPLVQSDRNLDSDDFFPGAWQSFQWDGGLWALPTAVSPIMWIYDPEAFDQIALSYPNSGWTAESFFNSLVTFSRQNTIGFHTFHLDILAKALLQEPLYHIDLDISEPNIQTSESLQFLETLSKLANAGTINIGLPETSNRDFPLHLDTYQFLLSAKNLGSRIGWQTAPLPDGVIGVKIQSFAISAGTQYPELSYELAKYLSSHPDIIRASFGGLPARRSLIPELEESDYFRAHGLNDELYPTILGYMEQVLPISEMRYTDYFVSALYATVFEDQSVETALQEAQIAAENNLRTASEYRATLNLSVDSPDKVSSQDNNAPIVHFGVSPSISGLVSTEQWRQLTDIFREQDGQGTNIEVAPIRTLEAAPDDFDCFYELFNISSTPDKARILDLSPLIDADPNFTQDSLISQILSNMQWHSDKGGYPIAIYPELLWYRADYFQQQSNLADWTIDEFIDALSEYTEQDLTAPFLVSSGFDITQFLMLAAAYGSLPFDYRTSPPALQLDNEITISAILGLLDRVRNGELSYTFLQNGSVASGFDSPLIADSFINSRLYLEHGYLPAVYPRNSEFTPASYTIGFGHISANSPYVMECYAWFKLLALYPEVVQGLPVQRAEPNYSGKSTFASAEVRQFYDEFIAQLNALTVVVFPGQFGVIGAPNLLIESIWLEKALKDYVNEGTPLEESFSEIDQKITAFRECINRDVANPPYIECAKTVDPSLNDDPRLSQG